jgi:alkylated DNA repair dioxygenase AlkB
MIAKPLHLISGNCFMHLHEQILDTNIANEVFKQLLTDVPWHQAPVTIFGKQIMQPRLTAFYGDPGKKYTYSGITMEAIEWIEPIAIVKRRVEEITNTGYNSVLLNLYRNNNDSMGWHRDNEKSLGTQPAIASVSFGATRLFKIRQYNKKGDSKAIALTHNSLLYMGGNMQNEWEHSVPKTAKPVGIRINLTFRQII